MAGCFNVFIIVFSCFYLRFVCRFLFLCFILFGHVGFLTHYPALSKLNFRISMRVGFLFFIFLEFVAALMLFIALALSRSPSKLLFILRSGSHTKKTNARDDIEDHFFFFCVVRRKNAFVGALDSDRMLYIYFSFHSCHRFISISRGNFSVSYSIL